MDRFGDGRRKGFRLPDDIVRRDDRLDAREPQGGGRVDGLDPGVRVGSAKNREVVEVRDGEIIDELAPPHEESRVLLALQRLSHPRCRP
ncbi:MAG: hypothetical protein FD129_3439, partial [bacterium]